MPSVPNVLTPALLERVVRWAEQSFTNVAADSETTPEFYNDYMGFLDHFPTDQNAKAGFQEHYDNLKKKYDSGDDRSYLLDLFNDPIILFSNCLDTTNIDRDEDSDAYQQARCVLLWCLIRSHNGVDEYQEEVNTALADKFNTYFGRHYGRLLSWGGLILLFSGTTALGLGNLILGHSLSEEITGYKFPEHVGREGAIIGGMAGLIASGCGFWKEYRGHPTVKEVKTILDRAWKEHQTARLNAQSYRTYGTV